MQSLIQWLASKLPNPRVIYDRNGRSPYLSRYYLVGAPEMSDGSSPYDEIGAPKKEAYWPNKQFGVYLHHFHRGDYEQELHNHPWQWAVSLILSGGYIEERRMPGDSIRTHRVTPGSFNLIRSSDFHRVDLIDQDAWTLFIVGPKFTSWGFWNRHTGLFVPWRQFINELRDPTAFARPNP